MNDNSPFHSINFICVILYQLKIENIEPISKSIYQNKYQVLQFKKPLHCLKYILINNNIYSNESSFLAISVRSIRKIRPLQLIYSYDPNSTVHLLELERNPALHTPVHNTNYTANFANPPSNAGKKFALLLG